MSNFHQLKSMWQSKGKVETNNIPPPKPVQTKIATSTPPVANPAPTVSGSTLSSTTPLYQPKSEPQNQTINQTQPQIEEPKMGIADIRKLLETNLKMGLNLPMNQRQTQNSQPEQPKLQTVEPKRDPRDIKPLIGRQRMPTFEESKQHLQQVLEKRKNQSEGYFTGPPPPAIHAEGEAYIDLKKAEEGGLSLSPEERTQQVMKRIFSTPESQSPSPEFVLNSHMSQSSSTSANKSESLLSKQEEAMSLNLRGGQKKQKKNLGDFDDM